ncbi:MAG: glycosyl hydrolase, partial [Saprospiraceae bacterium]|nr:glycosyl hydrolase [Saprospiraceae bacterium]
MNISILNESQCQSISDQAKKLVGEMTLVEKIGQMSQVFGHNAKIPNSMREDLRAGKIGSVLNEVDLPTLNEMQRICMEESRLKIPLLIGRDVNHGFKTIFPIPLGQAASWDTDKVEKGAHVAAKEAASKGVNWTFAPMIDFSRAPRWG